VSLTYWLTFDRSVSLESTKTRQTIRPFTFQTKKEAIEIVSSGAVSHTARANF